MHVLGQLKYILMNALLGHHQIFGFF